MIKLLSVLEQIVEIPFRLIVQTCSWRARQHRLHVVATCENIYRLATAKHPIVRRTKASALPSHIARSYRATTAYQAPVWPDSLRRWMYVDMQSTCIRTASLQGGLGRERSFCMSPVRLLSRIPGRRLAPHRHVRSGNWILGTRSSDYSSRAKEQICFNAGARCVISNNSAKRNRRVR